MANLGRPRSPLTTGGLLTLAVVLSAAGCYGGPADNEVGRSAQTINGGTLDTSTLAVGHVKTSLGNGVTASSGGGPTSPVLSVGKSAQRCGGKGASAFVIGLKNMPRITNSALRR